MSVAAASATSERMTRRPHMAAAFCVIAVVTALLASACGVPLDSAPQSVLAQDLHPDLLPPTETTEAEIEPVVEAPGVDIVVHLVDSVGTLVPVSRNAPATPQGVLEALLEGPTDLERARGFGTALGDVEVQSVDFGDATDVGKIVFVKLTEDSFSLSVRDEELAAFGQMTYTLTALEDVELVSFTRDGDQVRIPTDVGSVAPATAVNRSNFASLTPRPAVGFADDDGRGPSNVSVYFVNQAGRLQPVARTIETTPQRLFRDLFIGPSVSETAVGLTSTITGQARTQNITLESELQTAIIDLVEGSTPGEDEPDRRLLAFAQIVYTITELPDVENVLISIGGRAQSIDGTVEGGQTLTRADFIDLLAFAP